MSNSVCYFELRLSVSIRCRILTVVIFQRYIVYSIYEFVILIILSRGKSLICIDTRMNSSITNCLGKLHLCVLMSRMRPATSGEIALYIWHVSIRIMRY